MADKTPETTAAKPKPSGKPAYKLAPLREAPPEVYADGILGIAVRQGVAKIDFYRSVGLERDTGTEVVQLCHRVAMPVTALRQLPEILRKMASSGTAGAAAAAALGGANGKKNGGRG